MNLPLVILVFLATAVLIAWLQLAMAYRRRQPRLRRSLLLAMLTAVSAVLLYLLLFPPLRPSVAVQPVVLSAHAQQVSGIAAGRRVALPEAAMSGAVEQVPDLASLFRQTPNINSVHVVGDGLTARDREALAGRALRFQASPLPSGLVDFWMPETINTGNRWQVRVRIRGIANARLELRDPSGTLVDVATPGVSGTATLSDTARIAGRVNYQLQLRNAAGKLHERFTIPLAVSQPSPLKLLSHAGGPGPDLKALRRWAVDAGLQLQSRIDLAPGMAVRTLDAAITPATLAAHDLLIVDERAWQQFSIEQRRNIHAAVGNGLGLLLRITGPLSAQTIADFQQWGLHIDASTQGESVRLASGGAEWPTLSRRPVRVRAVDATVALRDVHGEPLAVWRDYRAGRVGVLLLSDSYRLALAGFSEAHHQIWSDLVAVLARPHTENVPTRRGLLAWPHQRSVFCHLSPEAFVQFDAKRQALIVADAGVNQGCAAYWPKASGWHTLVSDGHELAFYVHSPKEGVALQRSQTQAATLQLARPIVSQHAAAPVAVPGSPWPWFIAWLIVSAMLWGLERSSWGAARAGAE